MQTPGFLRAMAMPGRSLLVTAMLLVGTATSTSAARSLRDTLSPEDFHRAGLDKLSDAELAYLSHLWLGESAAAAAPSAPDAASTAAAPVPPPTTVPKREVAATPPSPSTSDAPEPDVSGEAAFGQEDRLRDEIERKHRIPKRLESRILGEFRGWDGHTTFSLENGQVWQQIDETRFVVRITDPEIVIEKGAFNTFYLGVKGYGSRAKVKRIK